MKKVLMCAALAVAMLSFSSCKSEGEKAAENIIDYIEMGMNAEAYQLYLQYCMTLSAQDVADMNTTLTEEGCYYYED